MSYIPRKTLGFVGLLGSGKTLLMTIFAYLFHLDETTVYTNYKTTFSKPINPNDLLTFELKDCILAYDEIETLIDSRVNSKSARYVSYFGLQSRKRHVFILWTSQFSGMIDKRIRFISRWIFLCERTGIEENSKGENITDFVFTLMYNGIPIREPFIMTYEDSKQFWNLYDTDEPIYPIEMLRGGIVDFNKVLDYYNNSSTKNSFLVLMRLDYPYITKENIRAVYELIRDDNIKYAKKILRVDIDPIEEFKVELI